MPSRRTKIVCPQCGNEKFEVPTGAGLEHKATCTKCGFADKLKTLYGAEATRIATKSFQRLGLKPPKQRR